MTVPNPALLSNAPQLTRAFGPLAGAISGRWHSNPADDYIAAVHTYHDQRTWTTGSFINSR